jgi:hypothetical protein
VANGRDYFEKVRASPSDMPKDVEFEALIYVARSAFERKHGRHLDEETTPSFETFSNLAGWPATEA